MLLCKEKNTSPVFFFKYGEEEYGLYEVPLSMSLLGFGMETMFSNFHVCDIMLLFRAVLRMLVRNVEFSYFIAYWT